MENIGRVEEYPTSNPERVCIGQTMKHYLQNLDDGRLPREKGILQVLSVGCGLGYEAESVLSIFLNCHYKGIDINGNLVKLAQEINDDLPSERAEFIIEDAIRIEESEVGKYGLVIVRHPQLQGTFLTNSLYGGSRDTWKQIIESTIKKISHKGYIFVTIDGKKERDIMLDYLREQGIEVLVNEKNDESKANVSIHKDSLIIIAHKK